MATPCGKRECSVDSVFPGQMVDFLRDLDAPHLGPRKLCSAGATPELLEVFLRLPPRNGNHSFAG
jgi:hypothetical protein